MKKKHFAVTVGALSGGRVVIASSAVNVCKLVLAIAVRYGFARKQFGPAPNEEVPIMSYPTHQVRIMPLLARTIAFNFAMLYLQKVFANKTEKTMPFVHALSSLLKATAAWNLATTIQTCRETCGGQGFRSYSRFGLYRDDTDVFSTFEGDNTVLMQQVSRYLLYVFNSQSKSGKFSGILTHLGNGEYNGSKDIYNFGYQQYMFEQREKTLLIELATRISNSKKSQWERWLENMYLVIRLAHAHGDRLLHEIFGKYIQDAPQQLKTVLTKCCHLDTMIRIRDNLGFFVDRKLFIEVGKIDDMIVKCCAEITPVSLNIVKSFGIPKNCLPDAELIAGF